MSRRNRSPSPARLARMLLLAAVLVPCWTLAEEPLVIHAGGAGSIRYPTTARSHTQASGRNPTTAEQRTASASDSRTPAQADERRSGASNSRRSAEAGQRYGSIRLDSQ